MKAFVEVIRADGSRGRHPITGEQATLGSSPTAGVPLVNSEDLQGEHLLLAPRPDGCWVAVAQGALPMPVLDGRPITAELVPWGTELQLGDTRIRVANRISASTPKDGSKKQASPILMIGAPLVIAAAAYFLLNKEAVEPPAFEEVPHPELFDGTVECPPRGNPEVVARESAEGAAAKADRYPFDPQDGIDAVRRYEIARACFTRANLAQDAAVMSGELRAMSRRIEDDYLAHRIKLERELKEGWYEDALPEAEALYRLTRHREGSPYVEWLKDLIRNIRLLLDQQG